MRRLETAHPQAVERKPGVGSPARGRAGSRNIGGLQFCRDNFADLPQARFILGIETIELGAIDIQNA